MGLSMTVRAQQVTFVEFALKVFSPFMVSNATQAKIFLSRVSMMKFQRTETLGISTPATGASFILHTLLFELTLSNGSVTLRAFFAPRTKVADADLLPACIEIVGRQVITTTFRTSFSVASLSVHRAFPKW
jgi:hypothetical protein